MERTTLQVTAVPRQVYHVRQIDPGEGMTAWLDQLQQAASYAISTGAGLYVEWEGVELRRALVPVPGAIDWSNQTLRERCEWSASNCTLIDAASLILDSRFDHYQSARRRARESLLAAQARTGGFFASFELRSAFRARPPTTVPMRPEAAAACVLGAMIAPAPSLFAHPRFRFISAAMTAPRTLAIAIYMRTWASHETARLPDREIDVQRLPTRNNWSAVERYGYAATVRCALHLERRWGAGFDKIVWFVASDDVSVRRTLSEEFDQSAASGTRRVVTTHSRGRHTAPAMYHGRAASRQQRNYSRKQLNQQTRAVAEATVDWWLLGEADLAVVGTFNRASPDTFVRTALARTSRAHSSYFVASCLTKGAGGSAARSGLLHGDSRSADHQQVCVAPEPETDCLRGAPTPMWESRKQWEVRRARRARAGPTAGEGRPSTRGTRGTQRSETQAQRQLRPNYLKAEERQSPTACDAASSETFSSDGVIVMLAPPRQSIRTEGGTDWSCALTALRSLRHVRDNGTAVVKVLHDTRDRLSRRDLEELVSVAAPRRLCTIAVELANLPSAAEIGPANLSLTSTAKVWRTPSRKGPSRWGYYHMIRFFFFDLFEAVSLAGHRFWMRLDSDAAFEAPLTDPFQLLRDSPHLGYLHSVTNEDCGAVVEGLTKFVRRWAADEAALSAVESARLLAQIAAVQNSSAVGRCVLGYYNNAEVGRFASFRSPRMARFRAAVLRDGGIYRHRWGDALLRRISIEADELRIAPLLPDFMRSYRHGTCWTR